MTYGYNGQHSQVEPTYAKAERGPPSYGLVLTLPADIGRWSRGALARATAGKPTVATADDASASLAQVARTTATTWERRQVARADLVALDRHGVAAKTAALTEREIGTAVDDVLGGASFYKQSQATQYLKPGGFGQANADFDALTQGVNVIERGGGLRTATLSNGTKVNVRPFSSGKYPTLEIDTPGNPALKIRY